MDYLFSTEHPVVKRIIAKDPVTVKLQGLLEVMVPKAGLEPARV